MLINLSNHPSTSWSEKQLKAANEQFGEVVDIQFPRIEPTASKEEVQQLATSYFQKCIEVANTTEVTIHIMGEMTFVVAFEHARIALYPKVRLIASTSERKVKEWTEEDGTTKKNVVFNFIQFRPY